MWAAHGVTSKSRARWLWLLFCRCAVGLQRVNVNNPGGIDLEIGLALSALWVSLASSSMCFPSSAYKVKKGTQLGIRQALASRIQPASTCVVAPRQRLPWALWTLRPAPHSRRWYPLVSLTDSGAVFPHFVKHNRWLSGCRHLSHPYFGHQTEALMKVQAFGLSSFMAFMS